jgi:pimeloyl-ACP methyl ester carboxylesterase
MVFLASHGYRCIARAVLVGAVTPLMLQTAANPGGLPIEAFSETNFTDDLEKFNVPTLIIHGDDDQIVPIGASAHVASTLVKNATLKVYPGGSHGLADTHKDQLNADLVAFLRT